MNGTFDIVVVGGGAAGLSAALVLTRARRRVTVVDAGQPCNAPAAHRRAPPEDAFAVAGSQAAVFAVRLTDGTVLHARRVLVTTGLRDDVPDVSGVRERWDRDLLHCPYCPYCHGYEVRDQPLGVLGGTPEALAHAHIVRQWSNDVVYFADGQALTSDQRKQLVARAVGIVDEPSDPVDTTALLIGVAGQAYAYLGRATTRPTRRCGPTDPVAC